MKKVNKNIIIIIGLEIIIVFIKNSLSRYLSNKVIWIFIKSVEVGWEIILGNLILRIGDMEIFHKIL